MPNGCLRHPWPRVAAGQQTRERPQPYAFVPHGGELVGIGAMWEPLPGPDRAGAVILMIVPANQVVAPVHDRLPLVVPKQHLDAWLDPEVGTAQARNLIVSSSAKDWR